MKILYVAERLKQNKSTSTKNNRQQRSRSDLTIIKRFEKRTIRTLYHITYDECSDWTIL